MTPQGIYSIFNILQNLSRKISIAVLLSNGSLFPIHKSLQWHWVFVKCPVWLLGKDFRSWRKGLSGESKEF
jgi:hypothetical protein